MPENDVNLRDFPVPGSDTLPTFQAMVEELRALRRLVNDLQPLLKRYKEYPWVSMRLLRITTSSSLGASKYNARVQREVDDFFFDPNTDLTLHDLYEDVSTTDDVYVVDIAANGVPAHVHRWKGDGSLFVWGYFVRYAEEQQDEGSGAIDARPIFHAISIATASVLPCTLVQNGGANGTNGDGVGTPPTQPTYTYDIVDEDGNLIASAIAIRGARQYGHVVPASKGMYYGDFASSWHIVAHDEVIDAGACTPP
jgi:hypothetical protein